MLRWENERVRYLNNCKFLMCLYETKPELSLIYGPVKKQKEKHYMA